MVVIILEKPIRSRDDMAEIFPRNCLLPTSNRGASLPPRRAGARDDFHLHSGREDFASGVGPIVPGTAPNPSGVEECGRLANRSQRTTAAGALRPPPSLRPMVGGRDEQVVAAAEFECSDLAAPLHARGAGGRAELLNSRNSHARRVARSIELGRDTNAQ